MLFRLIRAEKLRLGVPAGFGAALHTHGECCFAALLAFAKSFFLTQFLFGHAVSEQRYSEPPLRV